MRRRYSALFSSAVSLLYEDDWGRVRLDLPQVDLICRATKSRGERARATEVAKGRPWRNQELLDRSFRKSRLRPDMARVIEGKTVQKMT